MTERARWTGWDAARIAFAGALAGITACAPPPPPPAPDPEPPEPFPHAEVWTALPGLEVDGRPIPLFTRLRTVARDSAGVLVRCELCDPPFEAVVDESGIVYDRLPPEVAAWGSLAEFALSVREAAAHHDLAALRPVMAPDFSFSFVGPQTPEAAFEVWGWERFATLGRVPALLDGGLTSRDGSIWSAPLAFVREPGHQGLRLGFRQRPDGRWEWLYLIEGILGG